MSSWMTIAAFISLILPFVIVGGTAWFVFGRARRQDVEFRITRPESNAPSALNGFRTS